MSTALSHTIASRSGFSGNMSLQGSRNLVQRFSGMMEVCRDLAADRLRNDTERVSVVSRSNHSRWPQPSPWSETRMPPAVLGVAVGEYKEYMSTLIRRYARSLSEDWKGAMGFAMENLGVDPIDDEELSRMVWETPFGRFLTRGIDEVDRQRFAHVLNNMQLSGELYKIDHAFMRGYKPVPGVSVEQTVALFELENDRVRPIAISVGDVVLTPADGESWNRARYFFLQGCSIRMPLGNHPELHFPMDSVIAISRLTLPANHPIRRLVEAHSYLQLPLNFGALYNRSSVAHNHQQEIYTPFPAERDGIFAGVADCYGGIEGNSAYPGYTYPMAAPDFPGDFCAFLGMYYKAVLSFCRRVVGSVWVEDPCIQAWGRTLHGLLPGFPSPEALKDPEVLARAVAGYVHTVSVWHSADHHGYTQQSINKIPLRLRIDPPKGVDDEVIPMDQWQSQTDVFRHAMAREMFFKPTVIRGITEVDYAFDSFVLRRAVQTFRADLQAIDSTPLAQRQTPLDQIACSIQF